MLERDASPNAQYASFCFPRQQNMLLVSWVCPENQRIIRLPGPPGPFALSSTDRYCTAPTIKSLRKKTTIFILRLPAPHHPSPSASGDLYHRPLYPPPIVHRSVCFPKEGTYWLPTISLSPCSTSAARMSSSSFGGDLRVVHKPSRAKRMGVERGRSTEEKPEAVRHMAWSQAQIAALTRRPQVCCYGRDHER